MALALIVAAIVATYIYIYSHGIVLNSGYAVDLYHIMAILFITSLSPRVRTNSCSCC